MKAGSKKQAALNSHRGRQGRNEGSDCEPTAAAKEVSADAVLAAVLLEVGSIFKIKEEQITPLNASFVRNMFSL